MLGEGIPPAPARLVSWIWDDEYVDMAELLCDSLEVQKRGSNGNNQQSELPGVEHVAADALSLCSFVTFLAIEKLKHRSIKTYLLAIRHLQISAGFPDPFRTSEWVRNNPSYSTSALGGVGTDGAPTAYKAHNYGQHQHSASLHL